MEASNMSHFRWFVIFLLFSITVINYMDRESIAYAIDIMGKTFHLSAADEGLILGAFGIGYIFTTITGGIASDRFGARITMTVAVFFWTFAMLVLGAATGFLMIFFSRVLLGLAEGPGFPSIARAVGDWLPKNERAAALSYSLISVPVALAIGGPIVTQLIQYISWRGMFVVLALLALFWIPFWWRYFRDFPEASSRVNAKELAHIKQNRVISNFDPQAALRQRQSIKNLWKFLLSNKTLLANYWAFFVFGYYLFFFMTWLPSYLEKDYHLYLTKVGLFTVLPWALGAMMMWCTGHLCDYIEKSTGRRRWSRSYPLMISQLLAGLSVIPVAFTHNLDVAMIFISLAVAFSLSANAAYYAINIEIAKERAATALGIMDSMFALAGFLSPAITGWLITLTGHFEAGFILLAAIALSSVVIIALFHHPDKAVKLEDLPESSA